MKDKTPAGIWAQLDGDRQDLIRESERRAQLTLPYLFTPQGVKPDDDGAGKDWQSVGAQCVNHLSTRLMLTLFAPSRPFLRLDASPKLLMEASEAGVTEPALKKLLVQGEQQAVKVLDQKALRPKLFETLKHLIVIGNALQVLGEDDETLRVMSLKHYVVKRNILGEIHTVVIREKIKFDELEEEVQNLPDVQLRYKDSQGEVCFYILIRREAGKYNVSKWVDDIDLGPDYAKSYTEEKLPYRVLTWSLPDEADYGTSMVAENQGDFESLSTLSRAIIEGAILASEYRWLANPGGVTRPEDFRNSKNGATIPGLPEDLTLVQAAKEVQGALTVQQSIAADYINRLGRAFLLSSAVTRDAERVTAEEIRLLASELEAGLGGAYSRLAVDLQKPLGLWLLKLIKLRVNDQDIIPTIVTGLDALSRNGDLEALRRFLDDVVKLGTLPPEVLERLQLDAIFLDLGNGHGIDATKYVIGDAAVQQKRQQAQAAAVAESNAIEAGKAQAQGAQPQ